MIKKVLNLLFILSLFFSYTFAKEDLQKVTLALQWLDQFQFAGYYMAKEKGFYRDVGLDVEFVKYTPDETPLQKVLNHKATYGIGGLSILTDIGNGADVIMLGALFQSTPMVLLSRADSKISSVDDLAAKRVMFSKNMLKEIKNMLFGDNFPLNQIIIQQNSYNLDDLIEHRTDVVSAYISNEPFILKQKGIKYSILNPKDYGYDFYSDILFTSRHELDTHRQRVADFRDASIKGWEYAFSHISETVDLILKKYNTQNKSKEALLFEANELKKLAYYKTDKLGYISKYKIKKIYDFYRKKNNKYLNIDVSDYLFQGDNSIFFTKKEKEYISKNETIKYVYDPDWRPFEWKNGLGNHMGIIADILKIVSKKSGLKFKAIKTDSWLESTKLMQEHKADMYSAVPKTKKRQQSFKFTKSDIYSYTAVFISNVKNKELILNDINHNITGKKVGIIKGNSLGSYIKKRYKKAKFIEMDSLKSGFDAIRDKRIDFFVINAVSANYYIHNKGYADAKIYANADYMFRLKVALQKDMPDEVLSILDKTLKTISDEDKEAIFVKWITMKIQHSIDWDLVWKILFISFIVVLILIYILYVQAKHNKALSKEILDRKIVEDKLEKLNKELDIKIENAIKELKDKNENFKELLNSTMEMIVISDADYNVVEANKVTVDFFKANIYELRSRTLFDGLKEEDIKKVKKALMEDVSVPYEVEVDLPHAGSRTLLVSGKNIMRDGNKMRISTLLDITELKRAQHQLVQQNRLAQMGEMISMIAHQWRQPLSAISATSGSITLKAKLGKLNKENAIELSTSITDYAQHLSSTIDDFRNFFKEKKHKESVSLKEIVNATLAIVKMSLEKSNIDMVTNLTSDKEIQIYANELKQVVLNIIKNAQDALIEQNIQNPKIEIYADDTTIIISDNAGGVPEAIIDKIFEPYYSTKMKKDGTGLGLYMSKIIIEEHCGGKLSVANDKNGAVFTIKL